MGRDLFKDIPGVTLTPGTYPAPTPLAPDELIRGGWWSLHLREGAYVLDYISGELVGRAKSTDVTTDEAEILQTTADDATVASIIIAHGGG